MSLKSENAIAASNVAAQTQHDVERSWLHLAAHAIDDEAETQFRAVGKNNGPSNL